MKAGASQTALYQLYAELFKTQSEDQIKEWGDKMYHAELQAKQVLVAPQGFLVWCLVTVRLQASGRAIAAKAFPQSSH